jgi:DNA-binding LytR/AlgR family response regulator
MRSSPVAVIAEDEPALAEELRRQLSAAWPELTVAAIARDGIDALAQIGLVRPDVAFLDIRMPGLTGLEVARRMGAACRVVFVTAYDEHAVDAFEQGAADYLLKPLDPERLARTVARLRGRLHEPAADLGPVVDRATRHALPADHLQWLQVGERDEIRFVPVADVSLFQAADKYTLARTAEREWVMRLPLRDLEAGLDPALFWRVHRNTIVRVGAIERVARDLTGRLTIRLRDVAETVAVSRAYVHRFRQM